MPGLRRTPGLVGWLSDLPVLRMGPLRVTAGSAQLDLGLGPTRPPLTALDTRARGTAFVGLPVLRAINPPATTGMDFWTLNPYVGCELGCCYCYARAAHRYTSQRHGIRPEPGRSPAEAFERTIFVKRGADRAVLRTLDPSKLEGQPLLIGTATDPYQPAERRFEVTRSVLKALSRFRGLEIWLTTKSPLVARDIDLLAELAAHHRLSICISLISLDPGLIRRLEPRTPLPHARLRAVRALADARLGVGILIAPIVPGLTDAWGTLGGVMAAAKDSGAQFAVGSPLRLASEARVGFLPVLEREYPDLVGRYRRRYGSRRDAGGSYITALGRRLRALQAIHGFPQQGLRFGGARTGRRSTRAKSLA